MRLHSLAALAAGSIAVAAIAAQDSQRWIRRGERLSTDGVVHSVPLPNKGSAPTTISIARDGTVWFTESAGNRIGRFSPDGSNLAEFPLPHPGSSPRIIAIGSDGNVWFSEHEGNRIGRLTPKGEL